jgi:S2P endopeptidase
VPAKDAQLLRLTVRPSIADVDGETVVLWSGPPVEIWEEGQWNGVYLTDEDVEWFE